LKYILSKNLTFFMNCFSQDTKQLFLNLMCQCSQVNEMKQHMKELKINEQHAHLAMEENMINILAIILMEETLKVKITE